MGFHDKRLSAADAAFDVVTPAARHALGAINVTRFSRRVVTYTPALADVERMFEQCRAELGSQTTLAVVRRVMSANPNCFQAFARRERYDWADPKAEGFIAWLPLSASGLAALLSGHFRGGDPATEHLAGQHEKPAAIYVWAIYAPGPLAGGVALAFDRMSTPLNREADLYAWGPTPAGRRLIRTLGFVPLDPAADADGPGLRIFRRSATAAARPLYDSYPSPTSSFGVTVVRTMDDLLKVMAVRSVAFIAEQTCPLAEEFDGNDFSSTHLLGFVGDEPAAAIRIRCFADFAKVERLAVRPEYRRSRLAFIIVKAAHELCRKKGYARVYGHAQKRLIPFWSRAGARPFDGAKEFTFSDHAYVEMLAEIPRDPDAIAVGTDPLVIIRPEGRWHTEGVLDRSSTRAATNPVGARKTAS